MKGLREAAFEAETGLRARRTSARALVLCWCVLMIAGWPATGCDEDEGPLACSESPCPKGTDCGADELCVRRCSQARTLDKCGGAKQPVVDSATLVWSDGQAISQSCPERGTALYGQDSTYSGNLPTYTLDPQWVEDSVTGTMWQRASNAGAVWADAVQQCEALSLGGHDDWRLPSPEELLSVVDYGRTAPAVNRWLEGTEAVPSWTAEGAAGDDTTAWVVDFADGTVRTTAKENTSPFRCARGPVEPHTYVSSDDTATDERTGLMWQRAALDGVMSWSEALEACEGLELEERTDWRLPSVKELSSIVNFNAREPAIDSFVFPDTIASLYWSSTPVVSDPPRAWQVDFRSGAATPISMTSPGRARCVACGGM